MSFRYLIVSPCRNEADFIRQTLDTVTTQSVLPAKWVLVDDGSTDETAAIIAEYADRFDFIELVRRDDRGRRKVGGGVVDAFYAGLEAVDLDEFDFLCKLDVDLELPEKYFELLMAKMDANPRIGTCSGKAYYHHPKSGQLVSEQIGDDVSVGASKFYRTECFQQIGGFVREVMWDGIDCHRCRMHGWQACSWDDPELRFIHLRPMGSSEKGILRGRRRHGYGQYYMGTSLAYVTASAAFRLASSPRVIGSAAMWWGFVEAMMQRKPQYGDSDFRQFLRNYQWTCLLRGKKQATAEFDQRHAHRWKSHRAHASAPARHAPADAIAKHK